MKKAILALVLSSTSFVSFGQNMIQAELTGQPLVYQKDGEINGCGVRVFSLLQPALGHQPGRVLDVSFNLYKNGSTMVKGILSEFDLPPSNKDPKFKSQPITKFWMKAQGAQGLKATHPLNNKFMQGEDPNSILYSTSLDSTLDLFLAVLDKRQIAISIKRKNESSERIFYGEVKLNQNEMVQIKSCIDDALREVK